MYTAVASQVGDFAIVGMSSSGVVGYHGSMDQRPRLPRSLFGLLCSLSLCVFTYLFLLNILAMLGPLTDDFG